MPTLKALAPLDESSRDRIILPQLVRLAKLTEATIYLLHVIPIVRTLAPHAVRSAESYLGAQEAHLRTQGIDAHSIARRGDPATEILKVATEYDVDAIIMGTRGRRGLDQLLLGSVAEAVVSRSPVPVTLVSEAMASGEVDEKIRTQSSYMGGIIWNRVARGLWSEQEAATEMERLEAIGLDHDVLKGTYTSLQQTGAPADWLDFDFQVETLREFAPDLAAKADETAAA
jgi:nucleotide-binding universal stress UspA family protein